MKVQVTEIRLLPGDKPTRAFADIRVEAIVLKDFRVMRSNGKSYVRAPFVTYKDKTGTLKFRQIVDLPDEARGEIDTLILSEYYRRAKEKQNDRAVK